MTKKKLPTTPEELKGASADVFEVLRAESDRGCVLVAAAFVEEGLELLLRSRMLTNPKVGTLFSGPMAPLGSFSAKIEIAQALHLLLREEYEDLNAIRALRNHFAHSYVKATFRDDKAVETVKNLHHFGTAAFPETQQETSRSDQFRGRFCLAAAWLAGTLHNAAVMATARERVQQLELVPVD